MYYVRQWAGGRGVGVDRFEKSYDFLRGGGGVGMILRKVFPHQGGLLIDWLTVQYSERWWDYPAFTGRWWRFSDDQS